MNLKDKKVQLGIGGAIALLIVGGVMMSRSSKKNVDSNEEIPTVAVIPTVESSVKVDLKEAKKKGEVTLSVQGAPAGTSSIHYEITYDAEDNSGEGEGPVQQGAIGKCDMKKAGTCEKDITLGTCSSGTCRYHKLLSPIRLVLNFKGNYGEKLFEKEYEL